VTFEDLMDGLERSYRLAGRRSTRRVGIARDHLGKTFAGARALAITAPVLERYALTRIERDQAAPASVKYELAILRRALSLAVKQAACQSPSIPDHSG
jgi:hypothetical protein